MDFIQKILEELIDNKLLRHTCGIISDGEKTKYKFVGSGIFAQKNDKHFLISASHVLEVGDEKSLYLDTGNGIIPIKGRSIRSDYKNSKKGHDIGFIELDKIMLPFLNKNYLFVDFDEGIDFQHEINEELEYLVFGYPESNKKKIGDKLSYKALYYLVRQSKQKVYDHYSFEKDNFIVFDFKGKTQNHEGVKVKVDDPYGISGCGAWAIKVRKLNNEVNIQYFLVGILTMYRKGKFHSIIAEKMSLIKEMIK